MIGSPERGVMNEICIDIAIVTHIIKRHQDLVLETPRPSSEMFSILIYC